MQTLLSAFIIQWLLAKTAQQWKRVLSGVSFNVMDAFEREKIRVDPSRNITNISSRNVQEGKVWRPEKVTKLLRLARRHDGP